MIVKLTKSKLIQRAGLIVGRLKGKMVRAARCLPPSQAVEANTIIGDKLIGPAKFGKQVGSDGWPSDDSYHEIVLRSSAQCLPMIQFDTALRKDEDGKECIRYLKKSLRSILNRLFNNGLQRSDFRNAPLIAATPLNTAGALNPSQGLHPNRTLHSTTAAGGAAAAVLTHFPGVSAMHQGSVPVPPHISVWRRPQQTAPTPIIVGNSSRKGQTLNYTAPLNLTTGIPADALSLPPASCNMKEKCVICHDRLKDRLCVALNACKHVFHRDCVQDAFKSKPQCPICRVSIGSPQGKSPSGTMTVSLSSVRCSGFVEDSIIITYHISPGHQLAYHDNPGKRHCGKYATAYLPNTPYGQNLLKRLKFAWLHGLSFTVGTSITTGATDQCTWASIHHKTSPTGGARAHGYPDPSYFENCNGELDGLGVPSARELHADGSAKQPKNINFLVC